MSVDNQTLHLPFRDIKSCDLCTFYTTIYHSDLKSGIQWLVLEVFNKNQGKKLIIRPRQARKAFSLLANV